MPNGFHERTSWSEAKGGRSAAQAAAQPIVSVRYLCLPPWPPPLPPPAIDPPTAITALLLPLPAEAPPRPSVDAEPTPLPLPAIEPPTAAVALLRPLPAEAAPRPRVDADPGPLPLPLPNPA